MAVNITISIRVPFTVAPEDSHAEAALLYYSDLPGYLGLDHGSKSLVMLISIAVPIVLYAHSSPTTNKVVANTTGLIAGTIGFTLYSLSLMLQATSVEYAIKLFRDADDQADRDFAELMFDWSMTSGGLSVSIYILANIALAVWMITHSVILFESSRRSKTRYFSYAIAAFTIIGYITSWVFLMFGEQILHDVNEAIGVFFLIWISIIGAFLFKACGAARKSRWIQSS